jgi:Xaa-Pro aminopeptidase
MEDLRIRRRINLVEKLAEKKIDIAIITSWPTIYYLSELKPIGALTNSWNSWALLISGNNEMIFVCTRAFSKMMEKEYPNIKSIPFSEDQLIWPNRSTHEAIKQGIASLYRDTDHITLGIERGKIPSSYVVSIEQFFPNAQIINIDDEVTRLRSIKDEAEVEELRKAGNITNAVADEVIHKHIIEGMTEFDLEKVLIKTIVEHGASPAFIQIFSGERSCYQNISPTNRKIKRGDTILLDFGVRVESGYCSDITRAAVLGKANKAQLEISKIVKEIVVRTLDHVQPGKTAADIDRFVESQFVNLGYKKNYIHRTGHNVGLEPSEPFPICAANEKDVVKPNMCFAIEPGIYIDGVGIRLEDNIVTTESGIENLTSIQYEIISI